MELGPSAERLSAMCFCLSKAVDSNGLLFGARDTELGAKKVKPNGNGLSRSLIAPL
jgi:hypothetical protein